MITRYTVIVAYFTQ